MNYNEFKDYVKEHVLDYLPEQYKNANMDIRQAVKNNDVVLDLSLIHICIFFIGIPLVSFPKG